MTASSSSSTTTATPSTTLNHASPSSSSFASPSSQTRPYSFTSAGPLRAPGSGVTRYVVKTSDVLEDFRITVALESAPSDIIWHTERYLTPDQIVLHLIHSPTRKILWTVLRPTSTRRQGWYIRLRSPQFPEGTHIPMKPIPRISPFYVEEGCLSFRCRTNAIPSPSRSNTLAHGYSDSASSTDSSVHSYPPTPPTLSPVSTPVSLRSMSEDLLANSHSTVATTPTIGVPKSRDIVPPSLLISEATEDPSSPSDSSTTISVIPDSTSDLLVGSKPTLSRLQTPSGTAEGKRRALAPPPPPLATASEITEFILAPLDASAALYPAEEPPPSLQLGPQPSAVSTLTSFFSKAMNLIKSQTSAATAGTSFRLIRIPPAPKFSLDNPPPYTSTTSLPLSATSSASSSSSSSASQAESPTTPTAASYTSRPHPHQYRPQLPVRAGMQQTSFSSANLSSTPLPPPLMTFTDTTPYLTIYSNSGTLEINEEELRVVGVERAFWVAVAVMYWGYMGDREGWVWAGEE